MSDLQRLAERCEKATADEQRELLWEAFKLCFPGSVHPHADGVEGVLREVRFLRMLEAEAYESAAMSLVPDVSWRLLSHGEALIYPRQGRTIHARGATPALALCAAALRTRDAQPGDGR